MLRLLCVVVLVATTVESYMHYQLRIPNGERVPHPCKPNMLWGGVGHKNVGGGGVRNPFGLDFAANGHKWDDCICRRDSDGDGRTNGEELGDPDCLWIEGVQPQITTGLSHPGVCEPVDSPFCMEVNDWTFCDYEEFQCAAINETGVDEIILQFPNTPVPAKETSYFCMTFDLPTDKDYHLIANQPIIDNRNVMHHILVYGCDDYGGDDSWKLTEPQECGMAMQRCLKLIALWTLGFTGTCESEKFGFPVGQTGFKTVLLQFHWNNPEERADYSDMSGMKLYITPNLRPNDAAVFQTGPLYMKIPPALQESSHTFECPSNCTRWLPHSLQIENLVFHMHYLGRSAVLEHIRDGQVIRTFSEPGFNYDSPSKEYFDPPVEFLAGDELKLTCNFKTEKRVGNTWYGDATSDEMCFAFLTYYPARYDFTMCLPYKSLMQCAREEGDSINIHPLNGCDYGTFMPSRVFEILDAVDAVCNSTGETCPPGCNETVTAFRAVEPCLKGDLGIYTETEILARNYDVRDSIERLHACDEDWDRTLIFRDNAEVSNNQTQPGGNHTTLPPGDCVFEGSGPADGAAFLTADVLLTLCSLFMLKSFSI